MKRISQLPKLNVAVLFAIILFAIVTVNTGWAQQAAPSAGAGLEEIIVTGAKREADIQEIPISISAITEDALSQSRFNDVRALGTLAPGLVLSNPAGFNATGGGMRGTGTNIILVTQDAPVSFLVDEFALSHVTSQFVNLFDVQQIEVFRGPQGTLFGKNTTGGVISITSKKPQLGEYTGEVEADYGAYSSDQNIYSVKGALNLPLGDTIAIRIAAIADFDDGFYTDDKSTATLPEFIPIFDAFGIPQGTPLPPEVDTTTTGTGGSLGGKDVLASKIKFLWEPSEAFSAYFIGEFVRDNSDSPPGVNESLPTDLLPALGFPGIAEGGESDVFSTLISHNDVIQMDAGHRVDTDGFYLHLDWSLGQGVIKSITGYREEEQIFPSTYTGESFKTLFDSTRNTERETFQQEIRYVSQLDGPFNFVVGGNYYHDEFDFLVLFSVGLTSLLPNPVGGNPANGFVRADGFVNVDTRALFDYQIQGTAQERDQYGIYWDGSFDFTDDWRLTLGVRYSYDEKDFLRFVDGGGPCNAFTEPQDEVIVAGECRDSRSQYISRAGLESREFDGTNPLPLSAFTVVDTKDDWDETTYRAVLDYSPDDNQLIYLSYSTGFLSGGFSETCATPSRCAYTPETNSNIELGYKADLLDDTLRLSASTYFTEYEDLQRAVVANYTAADNTSQQETVTVNLGTSEVWGIDLEVSWLPADNWAISAALNWLDHDYTSGIIPALRAQDQPTPLEQFEVPYSPELKASLGVNYELPLSSGAGLLLTGLVNYQDDAETDVFNGGNTQMDSRTLVDLAVTYQEAKSRWSVSAYVANLFDEEYRIAALPVAGLWNFTNYGPPLSYGVRFNAKFGDAGF